MIAGSSITADDSETNHPDDTVYDTNLQFKTENLKKSYWNPSVLAFFFSEVAHWCGGLRHSKKNETSNSAQARSF